MANFTPEMHIFVLCHSNFVEKTTKKRKKCLRSPFFARAPPPYGILGGKAGSAANKVLFRRGGTPLVEGGLYWGFWLKYAKKPAFLTIFRQIWRFLSIIRQFIGI